MNSATSCLCEACSDTPSPTYTRAYMRACMVQMVVEMSSKQARRAFFSAYEDANGADALKVLQDEVMRAWQAR